jgi:PAS domain S-box-containing protein
MARFQSSGPVINVLSIDRPRFAPGSLQAYFVAGLIFSAAIALRAALEPWVASYPFVTFFPAVIAVTFLCGATVGSAMAGLSVAAAWLYIFPPEFAYPAIYRSAMFGIGSGAVVAVIALMRAATANVRRLNETLRLSERKFRGLLESAPDAMIIIDTQRRIALVNAQAEVLFGHPRADILGQPIEMLIPERHHAAYQKQFAAFLRGVGTAPAGHAIDLQGVDWTAKEFPIEVGLAALETETGTLVSNAIRDVTQRQEIEAHLAEASKAKSDFLARMSHELRTPLNAIIGFSEILRDAVIGPLDARYRDYAGDIHSAGEHLQNIINDILDISKIEGGAFELREETVSIEEIVEACRRIITAMAERADVTLAINLPSFLPYIRADHLRLRQVLLNLLSNAVKFTPAGGRVSLTAAIEAEGAVITVEDTGIGMKTEDIAVALEPFRQIEDAQNRRFQGTGLGLPLAKALVELHGGSLDIKSMPAAGTVVRVCLPLERVATHAAA